MGPVILNLHSALAGISQTSESATVSGESDRAIDPAPRRDHVHLYALTRSTSGSLVMGHVSHSSHSSGSGHYSHASHTSHASHVSGSGHSSHVSGSGHSSHVSGSPTPPTTHHGRPDLRIGKVGGALHGNNIYGTLAHQTVAQTCGAGKTVSWEISVQNDATVTDSIRVHGTKSAHGFSVKYIAADGTNVTKEVEAGTFRTPRLTTHETYRLEVVVEATSSARAAQPLKGEVHATSVLSPGRTDVASFVAHRK
ncbi:MAG: hypothetical protein JWP74_3430 [Marmoricola sp.]|nr:hypothetical protein [Marmoricola sp.]